jgi:hypothetical protein
VNLPALAENVLAKRKPTLLLRLSGWFLLRLAERRFCGLLFQLPPRRTRETGSIRARGAATGCEPEHRQRQLLSVGA